MQFKTDLIILPDVMLNYTHFQKYMQLMFSLDVKNFTIRYPVTSVPSQETNYFCMTFELPQDGDYHMIATKPVIDNEYVMHHILLFGCGESGTDKYCKFLIKGEKLISQES